MNRTLHDVNCGLAHVLDQIGDALDADDIEQAREHLDMARCWLDRMREVVSRTEPRPLKAARKFQSN